MFRTVVHLDHVWVIFEGLSHGSKLVWRLGFGIDRSKSERKVGKTTYGTVAEKQIWIGNN